MNHATLHQILRLLEAASGALRSSQTDPALGLLADARHLLTGFRLDCVDRLVMTRPIDRLRAIVGGHPDIATAVAAVESAAGLLRR